MKARIVSVALLCGSRALAADGAGDRSLVEVRRLAKYAAETGRGCLGTDCWCALNLLGAALRLDPTDEELESEFQSAELICVPGSAAEYLKCGFPTSKLYSRVLRANLDADGPCLSRSAGLT